MEEPEVHYFVGLDKGTMYPTTKEEFVRRERAAGFRPKGKDNGQPATAGFGNGQVAGAVVTGPLTEAAAARFETICPFTAAAIRTEVVANRRSTDPFG